MYTVARREDIFVWTSNPSTMSATSVSSKSGTLHPCILTSSWTLLLDYQHLHGNQISIVCKRLHECDAKFLSVCRVCEGERGKLIQRTVTFCARGRPCKARRCSSSSWAKCFRVGQASWNRPMSIPLYRPVGNVSRDKVGGMPCLPRHKYNPPSHPHKVGLLHGSLWLW